MSGKYDGVNCFIPRIPLKPTDLPVEFEKLQFPVRLSFAMAIKISSVITESYWTESDRLSFFSHGQLYAGLSRVENPDDLYILAPRITKKTKNRVFYEALN